MFLRWHPERVTPLLQACGSQWLRVVQQSHSISFAVVLQACGSHWLRVVLQPQSLSFAVVLQACGSQWLRVVLQPHSISFAVVLQACGSQWLRPLRVSDQHGAKAQSAGQPSDSRWNIYRVSALKKDLYTRDGNSRLCCLWTKYIWFLAALAILHQDNGKEFNQFCPKTAATTFASSSVWILLIWVTSQWISRLHGQSIDLRWNI